MVFACLVVRAFREYSPGLVSSILYLDGLLLHRAVPSCRGTYRARVLSMALLIGLIFAASWLSTFLW